MTYQTLKTAAGETLVVLPLEDFEKMRDAAEGADAARVMAGVANGEIETLNSEETLAFVTSSTPLAFWRSKRGYTQKVLADLVSISQSYMAELEGGKRKGDPTLFKRLAMALRVRMEDLIE